MLSVTQARGSDRSRLGAMLNCATVSRNGQGRMIDSHQTIARNTKNSMRYTHSKNKSPFFSKLKRGFYHECESKRSPCIKPSRQAYEQAGVQVDLSLPRQLNINDGLG